MPQLLSDDEFNSQFGGGFRAAPSPVGMSGRFGAAVDRTQASLLGIGEAAGLPLGGLRRENQAEADASMQRYYRETGAPRSFSEVQGAGDFGSYVAGLAVDSAPAMVGIAAGGLAGGVPGAFAVGSALGTGDVLDNQREQSGETNMGTALPLGIAYGAADSMLGVGGMLARRSASTGIRALDRAGVNLLDGLTGVKGIAARTGVQALKTGAVESGSETFQEGMNQLGRMSVDQDETFYNERSAENFKESAIGGGLLGGLMGGAAGGWRRSGEQRDLLGGPEAPEAPTPAPPMAPPPGGMVGPRLPPFIGPHAPEIVGPQPEGYKSPEQEYHEYQQEQITLRKQAMQAEVDKRKSAIQESVERINGELGTTHEKWTPQHALYQQLEQLASTGAISEDQMLTQTAALHGDKPLDMPGVKRFVGEVDARAKAAEAPSAKAPATRSMKDVAIDQANAAPTSSDPAIQAEIESIAAERARIEALGVANKANNHSLFKELEALKAEDRITKAQLDTNIALLAQGTTPERTAVNAFVRGVEKAQKPTAVKAPKVERKSPAPTAAEVEAVNDIQPIPDLVARDVASLQAQAPVIPKAAPVITPRPNSPTPADIRAEVASRKAAAGQTAAATKVAPEVTVDPAKTVDGVAVEQVAYVEPKRGAAAEADGLPSVADIAAKVETLLRASTDGMNKQQKANYEVFRRRLSLVTGYEVSQDPDTGETLVLPTNSPKTMAEVAALSEKGVSRQGIQQQLGEYELTGAHFDKLSASQAEFDATTEEATVDGDLARDSGADQNAFASAPQVEGVDRVESTAAKAAGEGAVEDGVHFTESQAKVRRAKVAQALKDGGTDEAVLKAVESYQAALDSTSNEITMDEREVALKMKKAILADIAQATLEADGTEVNAAVARAVKRGGTPQAIKTETAKHQGVIDTGSSENATPKQKSKVARAQRMKDNILAGIAKGMKEGLVAPGTEVKTEADLAMEAARVKRAKETAVREVGVWYNTSDNGRLAAAWWNDRATPAGQPLFATLPPETQFAWVKALSEVTESTLNDRTFDNIYDSINVPETRDSAGDIRQAPGAVDESGPSAPDETGGGREASAPRVAPTVVVKKKVVRDALGRKINTDVLGPGPTEAAAINRDVTGPGIPNVVINSDVTQAPTEAAPTKAETAPEWATEHESAVAGNVVYFDGETALLRGSSSMTGQNVYVGVSKNGSRTKIDISSYTGNLFTPSQLTNLKTQRERVAAEDTAKHEANPDGPFSTIAGGVSTGDSVTQALAMTLRGWVAKLGMSDMRILLIYPNDVVNADALGLYGPFSSARSAAIDGNESGSTRAFPSGLGHYIVLDPEVSAEVQLETLAHELGHIVEKEMLSRATPETQAAIEADYRAWLTKTKGMTARELADSLRNRNVAESMTIPATLMADKLGGYWTSKKEWFADNVSRWATTSKVPVSVVDRFFKSIADKFRALVAALTGRQFAPSPAVAAFMDSLVKGRDSLALASPVPTTEKDASSRSMQAAKPSKPSKPQEAAMRFLDVVKSKGANGLVKLMLTSDLISNANTVLKGIPLKYKAAMDAITAEKTKEERSVADIVEEFAKLSKTAQGTGMMSVNKMLKDSTMGKVWAFEPDWLPKGSVKVDPVLAKRFNDPEFSNESRALVKKVFKHGHDSLKALQKAVVDNTNSEYDALIQELTKAGKMDEAKAETAKKAKSLSDFESLLKVRAGWPYAPLRRFGKHVVMAMSARYKQAKNDGNVKLMRELESDGDHYFVAFAEGKMEALNMLNQIKDSYPGGDFGTFEKLEQADSMMGGRDMLGAMRRLRRMAAESVEDKGLGEKTGARVDDMMRQLYLTLLSETSARKGEIHRKNVAGANEDMMRAFSTQGVATAHFIASLKTNGKIEDHLADMRTEVSSSLADRDDKQRYFNEIMARHSMNLEFNPTPGIDKVLATSSIYLLLSNPSYFLMNATQPWMMSHPMMAGKHGYSRSASALVQGGKDALAAVRGGAFDEKSYAKLPLDVRDALEKLANKGVIQIELGQELGQFKSSPTDATRVLSVGLNKLRGAAQGVETFNRLSTAIAAYRLEKQRTGSAEAAIDYAAQVINETHGDYTGFNAPRFMRTGIGRVATQFRKFQLIQLSMFARLINRAFKDDPKMSKEENQQVKLAARYALGYNLAHLGAIGGAAALPGFTAAAWLVGKAFGDDEPDDPRATLTRAVGKDVADLLWGGASQAAGVPLGGRIGAGNMLSVLPYTDIAVTREGYSGMLMGLTGPLIGGLMPRAYDGIGMVASGISSGSGSDIWKGVEALVPSGVANLSKGIRYQAEGVTQRNGDVALSPEDISFLDSALQAVGLPTNTIQERTYLAGAKFKADTFYKDRTTQLKKAYSEAFRDNDAETLREVREEWQSTQRTRRELGFSVQPLSELLKAPQEQRKREAGMVGGVGSNKSTVGFLETMTGE